MKRALTIILMVLTVIVFISSCDSNITRMEGDEDNINYFIYPYLRFTLSEDRTYYIAEVVKGAKPEKIIVPGEYHTDFGAMPVKLFKGFENPKDSENLKELIIDAKTKISDNALSEAERIESIKVTGNTEGYKWFKLPSLKKADYHFIGWKAGDEFVEEGMDMDSSNTIAIPVWSELIHHEAKNSTCTEEGNIEYWECSDCHKYFTDNKATNSVTSVSIPPLGHYLPLVWVEPTEPTCQKEGNIGYYRCDRCKKAFEDAEGTRELSESDIKLSTVSHKPDEDWHEGINNHYHECIWCHEAIDVSPHEWDEGVVIKHPTLTEKGTYRYTCTVCGKTKDEDIPEGDHDPEFLRTVEPTCTERGYDIYKCKNCGEEVYSNYKDALGHDIIEKEYIESTCTTKGQIHHYHCNRCGKNFENAETSVELIDVVIPMKDHQFSDYMADEHSHWKICSICHQSYGESEPHSDGGYSWNNDSHWHICDVCGLRISEEEPHIFGAYGNENACECGYVRTPPHPSGDGGFDVEEGDIIPSGYLNVSENFEELEWTFKFVSTNEKYPIVSHFWTVDGVRQNEEGMTFKFKAESSGRYNIAFVFENEYAIASVNKVITVYKNQ